MFQSGLNWLQRSFRGMQEHAYGLLVPRANHCIICKGGMLQDSSFPVEILCQVCADQVPWIRQIHCNVCGRYETCYDCQRRQATYFVFSRSAVRYDAAMKEWLAQYKYRKNERLTALFHQMLRFPYERLKAELAWQDRTIHAVTYIPLSEERMEERGFNQSEQLARGIAELDQLPVIPLMSRTRHTNKQSYKTRAERLLDLQGAFIILPHGLAKLMPLYSETTGFQKLNILLVDDVYTTGSTLNQCAKVIASAAPANIYGLTWAR
jgi:competence protein ComFC